jgi:hypothetical protein
MREVEKAWRPNLKSQRTTLCGRSAILKSAVITPTSKPEFKRMQVGRRPEVFVE